MLSVVVISRNQRSDLDKMSDILGKMNIKDVVYVLDRCYDGSARMLRKKGLKYVRTPWLWIGRRTSSCRNLGLSVTNPNNDVIFLDGDRYPVKGDFSNLYKKRKDVLLFPVENDIRDLDNYEKYSGNVNNSFYSCGLFIKRRIINKIIDTFGELFPTDLEDGWGCEDLFLGDICHSINAKCDFYNDVTLNGSFNEYYSIPHRLLIKRFQKREKMNVSCKM